MYKLRLDLRLLDMLSTNSIPIVYEVFTRYAPFETTAEWDDERAGRNPQISKRSSYRSFDMTHKTGTRTESVVERVRSHQPGQETFRAVLSEDIEWKPFAAIPPSVRLAVIVGQPSQEGPYVIRVKVPRGVKFMPHRHPEDRIYTVISGIFYIGLGDHFDPEKLEAYPPGAVIVVPGDTSHFHWAKSGDYIAQVTAIGPLGLDYVHPKDDPRS